MYFHISTFRNDLDDEILSSNDKQIHLFNVPLDINLNKNQNKIDEYLKKIEVRNLDLFNFLLYLNNIGVSNGCNLFKIKTQNYYREYHLNDAISHKRFLIAFRDESEYISGRLGDILRYIFNSNPNIDIVFYLPMLTLYQNCDGTKYLFNDFIKDYSFLSDNINLFVDYLNKVKLSEVYLNKYKTNNKYFTKYYFDNKLFRNKNKLNIYKVNTFQDMNKEMFIDICGYKYGVPPLNFNIFNNDVELSKMLTFLTTNDSNKVENGINVGEHTIKMLVEKFKNLKTKKEGEIYNLLFDLINIGWQIKNGESGALFLTYKNKIYVENFLYGGNIFALPDEFKNVIFVSDIHVPFDSSFITGVTAMGSNPHLYSRNSNIQGNTTFLSHLCIGDLDRQGLDKLVLLVENLKTINYSSMYESIWSIIFEVMTSGNVSENTIKKFFTFKNTEEYIAACKYFINGEETNGFSINNCVYNEKFLPYSKLAIEKYRGYFNQLLLNNKQEGTIFTT